LWKIKIMKITKLKIDKHKHLENLEFDFTYPEDFHIKEKRGKPLDKICFIGQSGTGKTNLLELIYNDLFSILSIELDGENVWRKNGVLLSNYLQIFIENIKFESLRKDTYDLNILVNDKKLNYSQNNSTFPQSLFSNSNKVFFLKSSIISTKNINILNSNPLELKESIVDSNNTLNNTIEFDEEISPSIWYFILASVIDFHSNRYKKYNELIGKGLISDLTKFNKQVLEFLKENPNPLESLSKKFNPIFKKLGLQIDIDNTEYSIPIKNILKEEIIPVKDSSTGTKQILLTSLPLYFLDTQNTIILFDEPERSLYPDIQMELMDHYQNFAPEAQFIVATHSPFIAANFEPEERFILYFDKEGNVAVKRGKSPIGDDPNDMLTNDFGVNYINTYGQEKFQDYLELKQKMLFEKDEKLKKKYAQEVRELGDKYNF
jgi:ABC-type lipoprotein export system ATPase subunit